MDTGKKVPVPGERVCGTLAENIRASGLTRGTHVRFDRSGLSISPVVATALPTTVFVEDRVGRPNKGAGVHIDSTGWKVLRELLRSADEVIIQAYDGRLQHPDIVLGGDDPAQVATLKRAFDTSELLVLIAAPSQRVRVWLTELQRFCSPTCAIRYFDRAGIFRLQSESQANGS